MNIGFFVAKRVARLFGRKLNNTVEAAFTPKYLLYTNVGISFTLSGLGDIIEQRYEIFTGDLEGGWDVVRTRNMSLSGVSIGVICHYWYVILDKRMPGRTLKVAMKKLMFDQFVGSPICITVFFLTLTALEGKSLGDFAETMKRKAWKLYLADWVVWPPAQLINFYFLPTRYRVLYDNTISLGYDVYTSYVTHSGAPSLKTKPNLDAAPDS